MKRLRWQILIVTLALIAIAILLLTQQPTVLQTTAPVVQPSTGGVYTEGIIGSFGRLNPVLSFYNSADRDVNALIYGGLVRFDDRGLPVADLAESWGYSQDGMVYNFSIRQNAVWHDGEPVTSEDITFTVDLLRSDDLPIPEDLRALWKQIEIIIIDEKTIQFRLPEPFSPFLDYLAFGLLPKHILENVSAEALIDHSFNLEPIGSGPYELDRLLTRDGAIVGLVLTAFEDYYATRPFIDQFVVRYYDDESSALAAYRAGEVLGISRVTRETLMDVLQEPELNLYTGRLPQLTLIYLNLDDQRLAFFQEANLRRALVMSLNRQRLVDTAMAGQAILADGPIFPGTWAYYDGMERIPYDPDTAIQIFKEAGYTIPPGGGSVRANEGTDFSFEMVYPDDPLHTTIVEAIRSDWAKVGIEITPVPVSYNELVDVYLEPRSYQAALVDLNLMQSPDPDPYPFWGQAQMTAGQNYSQWNDRRASEYLELARISVDLEERAKAYRNFQVRFVQEMPAIPLFYPVYSYAVDNQVQGVTVGSLFDPSDRFADVASWFLVTQRAQAPEQTPTVTLPAE
ncbi:MAG: peptide ABC transporter substrate-binding protein [Anaerolineales bacterium]|nr:MAG: peptide ABC transporter substrate-binding protein [Anaerolineales bacterium]